MNIVSLTPRAGTVERTLLKGGFNRNAFLDAARLLKDRREAGLRAPTEATASKARPIAK